MRLLLVLAPVGAVVIDRTNQNFFVNGTWVPGYNPIKKCFWHNSLTVDGLKNLDGPGQDPIFLFLGLDKTGSTTIQTLLMRFLPEGSYVSAKTDCQVHENTRIFYTFSMRGDFDMSVKLSPRTVRFFTVLRDPYERLESAYNYFCASCEEGGRQCRSEKTFVDGKRIKPRREHELTCPNMTMLEYADAFQDIYVRAFSHAEGPSRVELSFESHQHTYAAAVTWIETKKPLIMFTTTFKEKKPLKPLGHFLGTDVFDSMKVIPHDNHHDHSIIVPQDIQETLKDKYFKWDYRLFEWLQKDYRQPVDLHHHARPSHGKQQPSEGTTTTTSHVEPDQNLTSDPFHGRRDDQLLDLRSSPDFFGSDP